MAITHVAGISDCKVSDDPSDKVVTYALGSCVGLVLYDPHRHAGGILHVLLPDSRLRSSARDFNPFMYADTGVRAIIEVLNGLGSPKDRLVAKAAGGANMLQHSKVLDIGKRNSEAVLEVLRLEKIPVLATSLGGVVGRSMTLKLSDGSVTVRLIGRGEETL
jgi:chemotaxis protein CheD